MTKEDWTKMNKESHYKSLMERITELILGELTKHLGKKNLNSELVKIANDLTTILERNGEIKQSLLLYDVLKANTEKICELIRQKFDGWVFGVETQSGEKLKVVDSTDFNQIITEIEKEIKECNIANVSWQSEQLKAFAEMVAKDDFAYLKNAETLLKDFESL